MNIVKFKPYGYVRQDAEPKADMFCSVIFSAEDVEWFTWAKTQLQQIAGPNGKITREKFRAALNIKQVRTYP